MPIANFAPFCPKCCSKSKVVNNLTDVNSYDLVRQRRCVECGHCFYTRQKREELLDSSLRVKWGQGKEMKNVRLLPR